MNKAFVREPDYVADYCPRCGSKGEPVGSVTLEAHVAEEKRSGIAKTASFCPSAQCPVAYFDGFERVILAADLLRPVYPKDPTAPVCACFGLTRAEIEEDARRGIVARVRAIVERAKSPEARCLERAANGRPCVAFVQKYFLQCLEGNAGR